MFWLDPNPNKKFGFGYGFGFRHCCKMNIFVKNQTLEREKSYVFLLTIFFLWRTGSRTHMKAIKGTI
jgi:hypothetical protein